MHIPQRPYMSEPGRRPLYLSHVHFVARTVLIGEIRSWVGLQQESGFKDLATFQQCTFQVASSPSDHYQISMRVGGYRFI